MELPLREGALIAGKYAIERVLGDGGMGVVVAAHHLELGERVALKFLLPEMATNPEARKRFVREARAAARIKGEHVARVLDVGVLDEGTPFIVMEYLEGNDLGRLLETRGALAVADALHYLLQACEAVAQAHAVGIVHRDLKPANLFLTTGPDGSALVKVLDFGISKSTSVFARTLSPDITTVNASVGTPPYMSPEQARDAGTVDARSDVWALGAILYELLTAKPAFDGDDLPALVMMIATEEPPALESLRPDVPVALAAVVRRCLRKNRDERFANVAELARALEPFAPGEARLSVARIARILGHDSLPPPATIDAPPSVRERRSGWLAVAVAGALTASLFGGFAWSKRAARSPVASAIAPLPLDPPVADAPHASASPPAMSSATSSPARPRPAATARARRVNAAADALERRSRVLAPIESGTLTFEANVPAAVTFDGRSLGTTPQSVTAPPGSHTVVFLHPELGAKSHALTIDPGQDKTIRATFEPRASR